MTMTEREAIVSVSEKGFFSNWMCRQQRRMLALILLKDGDECKHLTERLNHARACIETMPETCATEGEDKDATVCLHYFKSSADAWITARDFANSIVGEQRQAFGYVSYTGSAKDAEMGYTSIAEIITNELEMDLYWEPKPWREVLAS